MDAPKGRYSVIEKDGRLVVIDNGTGAPLASSLPPGRRPGGPSPAIVGSEPGPVDRAADLIAAIAARRRDSQGRALIAWEWRESGKIRRWDAALDDRQQRRLGRALLGLTSGPLVVAATAMAESALILPAAILAAPPSLWGWLALRRLYRETDDPALRG